MATQHWHYHHKNKTQHKLVTMQSIQSHMTAETTEESLTCKGEMASSIIFYTVENEKMVWMLGQSPKSLQKHIRHPNQGTLCGKLTSTEQFRTGHCLGSCYVLCYVWFSQNLEKEIVFHIVFDCPWLAKSQFHGTWKSHTLDL